MNWSRSGSVLGPTELLTFERDALTIAGRLIDDLKAAGALDAVYLDLHGAMVAEHCEDGEGALMRRIRAVIGEEMPLVASLDYHANIIPEIVAYPSAMVGYRTYPHVDMAEQAARAAMLLARLLPRVAPFHKAYRQIDFLIPLVWQCTLGEPARSIFDLLAEIEAGDTADDAGRSQGSDIVSITHTPGSHRRYRALRSCGGGLRP